MDVLTIKGIECYEKDGMAQLSLEAVSRGLGFTQTQTKNGIEYVSVRWERVEEYLADIGFPHKWGKGDFIPENIFYRLAMKAKNEAAEKFQALIADEVIPSIRKTGGYAMKPLTPSQQLRLQVEALEKLEADVSEVKTTVSKHEDALNGMKDVYRLNIRTDWRSDTNRMLKAIGRARGDGIRDYQSARNEAYEEVERRAHCDLNRRLSNMRDDMASRALSNDVIQKANRLDVIGQDEKLIECYMSVVKDMYAVEVVGNQPKVTEADECEYDDGIREMYPN
jgi:prophage antirepressor-like protein